MPKIRHIAYRADNVQEMAKFFVEGFEMKVVQNRKNGAIDLSDGTINITILPAASTGADGRPRKQGIDHIGFAVEDEALTCRLLENAGATKLDAIPGTTAHYEIKYRGPEGIGIDLGRWVGAAPLEKAEPTVLDTAVKRQA
jgi:catechol 2,3-dioxygenase-like lactoylglutathione lyase family enzyme